MFLLLDQPSMQESGLRSPLRPVFALLLAQVDTHQIRYAVVLVDAAGCWAKFTLKESV